MEGFAAGVNYQLWKSLYILSLYRLCNTNKRFAKQALMSVYDSNTIMNDE